MSTSKIKTAELTGLALDWAVAQVVQPEGFVLRMNPEYDPPEPVLGIVMDASDLENSWLKTGWSPSTEWIQGGPLIEKYHITFSSIWNGSHSRLFATIGFRRTISGENANGAGGKEFNYLLAACRAVVVAEMGDEVEVPQELISSQG